MNKILSFALSLFALASMAFAGTVTLTGGCAVSVIKNATAQFSISNTGNDTAFNMVLTPTVQNAQSVANAYTINALGPNSNATVNILFENITEKGTSPAYFVAAYQQGGSVFTAVFPCLLSFYNATTSRVLLSTNVTHVANGSAIVRVSAFNAGRNSVDANVSLAIPPTLNYKAEKFFLLTLAPYETRNVSFSLALPPGASASYSVSALASYSEANLSYATYASFVVASQTIGPGNLGSIFTIATVVVVVVILALILLSLRNRRKKQSAVVQ